MKGENNCMENSKIIKDEAIKKNNKR